MPPIPPVAELNDAAKDAQASDEGQSAGKDPDISKVVGSASDVVVDDVTYRRATKSGNWYNRDEFEATKKIILVKDDVLLTDLNNALKDKVKNSGENSTSQKSGTPVSGSSMTDEDKQKINSILSSLSPDAQKALKGIVSDSFLIKNKKSLSEGLLTGNRSSKKSVKKEKNDDVDRWLKLAGIK